VGRLCYIKGMDINIPGVYGVVVECWVGHEQSVPVVLVLEERDHQEWLIFYNYVERRELRLLCAGRIMAESAWPNILPLGGVIAKMASDTLGVEHNVVMVLERMGHHVLFALYKQESHVPAGMWERRRCVRLRLFWHLNRSSAVVVREDE
jgi:hypothetical protein